ncbi:tRNA (N(6)-L-threonylcarbamoyladenosine(37)-C(2))-methylthiotransferase MtaB [Desulfurispora thermophila]|uniref:tRNA (N(6)-L-threonylcarbamoyladenosine(37)-C(2))- methylthiotransferase MtaB n=1 Tax=Desulfurispora thermophila TaxID=265470 RepID=UPI00035FBF02|nr:tRNA (N(6)-L-threonylcarbamoyladenosine(37)-C(2))-methylthiotransferase MtaB [Desulfurispora thermophila]
MQPNRPRVAIATLGCKVNQYESAALAAAFARGGFEVVNFDREAEVYVINTCTVTHLGDRKSRQLIRRAVRQNPAALVVATGCYAQVSPQEVREIPGVHLVLGNQEKADLVEQVQKALEVRGAVRSSGPDSATVQVGDIMHSHLFQELPAVAAPERTRAFIKVQEGCNNFCAYCIIPYARGPVRSRPLDSVLEEAHRLVEQGYPELVITGIHIGAYGQDFSDGTDLARLVAKLRQIRGIKRLRLGSVEPLDFSPRLVEVLAAGPPVCRHLHIPLQSGDDTVLHNMRRRYTTADYARLVNQLRRAVPQLAITTDLITGFPGETDEQHRRTMSFVREMAFARLHVFKFSPRRGTPAASLPDRVPAQEIEERSRQLIELGNHLAGQFAAGFIGEQVEVLVEEVADEPGCVKGYTDQYLPVVFPGSSELRGRIVPVRGREVRSDILLGIPAGGIIF